MRAYRRILISNGLANIPAKVCSISSSPATSIIGNGCPQCQGDVGHKNYCKSCGVEPQNNEILKVLKVGKDERIPIGQDQLSLLKETDLKIEVKGTFPIAHIDGKYLSMTDSCYFIWEDEKAKNTKPLNILIHGLLETKNALVVNTTFTGKSKLGLIRPESLDGKNVLILQTLKFFEYANKVDEEFTGKLSAEEKKLGKEYVGKQLKQIDPQQVEDQYAKVIETIMQGDPISVEVKQEKKDDLAFFGGSS